MEKKTLNFVWLKSFLLRFRRLEITKSIKLNCWVVLKDLVIRFSFSSKHHSQECWRAEGEEGTIDEFRNRNERLSLNNKETRQFQMKNKWWLLYYIFTYGAVLWDEWLEMSRNTILIESNSVAPNHSSSEARKGKHSI